MSSLTRFGASVFCALITLVFSTVTVSAAQPNPLAWRDAQTLPQLIEHLDGWLDRHTDLPRSNSAPVIRQISNAQAARLHSPNHASQLGKTRGLYDADSETIYLVRPWDARNPFDVGVLLHELVHHRQKDARHWYCDGAKELPAYETQRDWLAQMGLEADINWIAVVLEAGCTPRDIHPD